MPTPPIRKVCIVCERTFKTRGGHHNRVKVCGVECGKSRVRTASRERAKAIRKTVTRICKCAICKKPYAVKQMTFGKKKLKRNRLPCCSPACQRERTRRYMIRYCRRTEVRRKAKLFSAKWKASRAGRAWHAEYKSSLQYILQKAQRTAAQTKRRRDAMAYVEALGMGADFNRIKNYAHRYASAVAFMREHRKGVQRAA